MKKSSRRASRQAECKKRYGRTRLLSSAQMDVALNEVRGGDSYVVDIYLLRQIGWCADNITICRAANSYITLQNKNLHRCIGIEHLIIHPSFPFFIFNQQCTTIR